MARERICDRNYITMWIEDKKSILETMIRNMNADLAAGYDPNGNSITQQKRDIKLYEFDMNTQINDFSKMDESKANRWCYYDLVNRGAITPIGG